MAYHGVELAAARANEAEREVTRCVAKRACACERPADAKETAIVSVPPSSPAILVQLLFRVPKHSLAGIFDGVA
jgi:hypothetical protein